MKKILKSLNKQKVRLKYLSEFTVSPLKNFFKNKNFRMNMQYAYYHDCLPVKANMILFETSHGSKMAGNPYAIFKEMWNDHAYKDFTFIWVLNHENYYANEYKKFSNVIFVKRDSKDYLKYLAQSKYLINDTTFPFYFQKKAEQVYVNTWHGTPIKTLGNDVKGSMGQHKNAIRNFLHADFIINPNKFTADIIAKAHDLNGLFEGYIADEGYPRMDLTVNADQQLVKNQLEDVLGFNLNKKIVLYAPTWRGEIGKVNKTNDEMIDFIKEIHAKIPDDCIFLLKVHDLTYKFMKDNNELEELCIPDWFETNELLSIVDILITDYSSIFFDYLITKKPILFFVYDREKYETERGLYLSLDDMPGPLCYTVDELINCIQTIEKVESTYKEKYEEALDMFAYHDDGNATKRFIQTVFNGKINDSVTKINATDKTKMLIFGGGFTTNGVTTSLLNLLKNLDYTKYDVTIAHGGKIDTSIQTNLQKLNENIKVIYRMGSFNFRLGEYYKHRYIMNSGLNKSFIKKRIPKKLYQKELHRIIGNAKFDIAIDFSGYSPFWALLFSFNDFSKKIIYLHSDMVEDSERLIKGKKKFKKNFNIIFHLYSNFEKLICVSDEVTETNREKLSIYGVSDKIVNVDNSIDYERVLDHLDEGKVEDIMGKEHFVLKHRDINGVVTLTGVEYPSPLNTNFVTLGRVSPEKDHRKLILAFSKVNAAHKNTRLYIIGDGELKKELNVLISELDLVGKVFLVGEMDNPFSLMNKCDCFVMSSNYEGQGLAVLEALIIGKPVVSTDISGPRGILKDGYGLLVENSEKGLKDGMESFILSKPTFEKFDYLSYNNQAMKKFYTILED